MIIHNKKNNFKFYYFTNFSNYFFLIQVITQIRLRINQQQNK